MNSLFQITEPNGQSFLNDRIIVKMTVILANNGTYSLTRDTNLKGAYSPCTLFTLLEVKEEKCLHKNSLWILVI